MEILQVKDLSFRYPQSDTYAISDINISVKSGEFTVICGQSGCGKTTLLKLLKQELVPNGEKSGTVRYNGILQDELDLRTSAAEIGYVLQNPESQIVTDKVWHELAFGPENLGIPTDVIRRRVAEMASFFGIGDLFRKKTDELSGGQKQMLNLAAVMVMQPKILLLDEPTSQLDPISARDFIETLQRLNRELGLTIILAEHRLEEVFPISDRVLVMENGRTAAFDIPGKIGGELKKINEHHPMLFALPSAVRIFSAVSSDEDNNCPITVREGRDYLESHFSGQKKEILPEKNAPDTISVELRNVWFRYERDLPDVLRGVSLKIGKGEIFCVLGDNGSGKTTMLNVISGIARAYRGKILIDGRSVRDHKGNSLYRNMLACLPQDPTTVFIKDTVTEDFDVLLATMGISEKERQDRIMRVAEKMGITQLLSKHPYDLSGGEQQKCAFAKLLLTEPKILLLDEPTKGIDAFAKRELKKILLSLKRENVTVLIVTHDVEFAAYTADRCALFFDGEILSSDSPERFFSENNFYTTAANRMARQLWPYAVTVEQVIENCEEELR